MATPAIALPTPTFRPIRIGAGHLIMAALIITIGFYIVYPVILLLINSLNIARINEPFVFSFDNWRAATEQRGIMQAMVNTLVVFGASTAVSFPVAVGIAWVLARV